MGRASSNAKPSDSKENPRHATLYLKDIDQQSYDELQEILNREHRSLSRWFGEQAFNYVTIHRPGNPQITLALFQDEKETGQPLTPEMRWRWCRHHSSYTPDISLGTSKFAYCNKNKSLVGQYFENCRECRSWVREIRERNNR